MEGLITPIVLMEKMVPLSFKVTLRVTHQLAVIAEVFLRSQTCLSLGVLHDAFGVVVRTMRGAEVGVYELMGNDLPQVLLVLDPVVGHDADIDIRSEGKPQHAPVVFSPIGQGDVVVGQQDHLVISVGHWVSLDGVVGTITRLGLVLQRVRQLHDGQYAELEDIPGLVQEEFLQLRNQLFGLFLRERIAGLKGNLGWTGTDYVIPGTIIRGVVATNHG